mgnify:CR=1 FL=1
MTFPYMIQGNNIVVVIDNTPHTINKSHVNYSKVAEAIKAKDWDALKKIINPEKLVLEYGQGKIAIQGEKIFWEGAEMHNALSQRMLAMLNEGFPIEPLVLFMENLQTNPSYRAVEELYGFLEKNTLPITPDGYFLAYKKVNSEYKDIHSGTVSNKLAAAFTDEEKAAMPLVSGKKKEVKVYIDGDSTVVEMPRNKVNDNKDQTCSEGLHFCSQSYLRHFGNGSTDHVMILKINPRDVVSVPSDYNDSKGRCCRYEIVGELGVSAEDAFTATVQASANV